VPGKTQRHGTLIAIGGGEDKTGERLILQEVVRRLKGKLIIATVAFQSPEEYFEAYERVFKQLGASRICANSTYGTVPRLSIATSNIGVGHARSIDDVHASAALHTELRAVDDDSSIFINPNAQDARILRDRAKQAPNAPALCEVLVDDDVAQQPESRSHM
jgi:cyanophycinase-like exopeptidase